MGMVEKLLLSGLLHLYGPLCRHRQLCRKKGDPMGPCLRAEAPSQMLDDNSDLIRVEAERFCEGSLRIPYPLRRIPDDEILSVPICHAGTGLNGCVVLSGCGVGLLESQIRFSKSFFVISSAEDERLSIEEVPSGILFIGHARRGRIFKDFFHVDHRLESFVLDLDEVERPLRRVDILGRDDGNLLSLVGETFRERYLRNFVPISTPAFRLLL